MWLLQEWHNMMDVCQIGCHFAYFATAQTLNKPWYNAAAAVAAAAAGWCCQRVPLSAMWWLR
jgi:hypothetical protein